MEITKEISELDYFQALLHASLLLSELHHTAYIREIQIAGFAPNKNPRSLRLRCRLIQQDGPADENMSEENYRILFPIRETK